MTAKASLKRLATDEVLPTNGRKTAADFKRIPWSDLAISPTNPRRRIHEDSIRSLAASIAAQDILEPLIVRKSGDKFEIVCAWMLCAASTISSAPSHAAIERETS